MESVKRTTVVGVFDNPDSARDAIGALKDAGFNAEDIGILMKDKDRARDMADETGSHAGQGAVTGAIGGGLLGGLAGWLVGIGSLAIPGVGPFIAAGAIGSAVAGAGIGAGVGAIGGALVGMGIPKEEAEWYEGEVRKGRTLVTVRADGRYSEAHSILSNFGAYDIENRYPGTASSSRSASDEPTTGVAGWDAGTVDPAAPKAEEHWEDRVPKGDRERDYAEGAVGGYGSGFETEGSSDTGLTTTSPFGKGPWQEGDDYQIVGGEGFPPHEHRFTGDRCEVCGAVRRRRAA